MGRVDVDGVGIEYQVKRQGKSGRAAWLSRLGRLWRHAPHDRMTRDPGDLVSAGHLERDGSP
jgi:hypothetical protein